MVLVDSSVWVDYFNGRSNHATDKLDTLLMSTTVAIGDLILAEVLQGFRYDTAWRAARGFLLDLEQHVLGGTATAQNAANNFRKLRRHGVTVRKTIDCIIATYCIETDIPLLHNDRDFQPFAQYLGP